MTNTVKAQKMIQDQAVVSAYKEYAKRQADSEAMQKTVDGIVDPILVGYYFTDCDTGEQILSVKQLYMTDEDCTEFYAECDTAFRGLGLLTVEQEVGIWPNLVAQSKANAARHWLLELVSKHMEADFTTARADTVEQFLKCLKGLLEG